MRHELFIYIVTGIVLGMMGCLCWSCEPIPLQKAPSVLGDTIPYPSRNSFSVEGIKLGRMLFYEKNLSSNRSVSCASCHVQALGFADATALSPHGVSGRPQLRHSPALINLAWSEKAGYFWDGGAKDLESQAFGPLRHPDEMAMNLKKLPDRLHKEGYAPYFKAAFGDTTINSARIARALAQFQRKLISADSPFDSYLKGNKKALNEFEIKGMQLFDKHCESCHRYKNGGAFFTDYSFHNNGLDTAFAEGHEGVGLGRFRITGDSADIGKFKTPTLRNISETAPYMHDGRFKDLKQVLIHYNIGIKKSKTLASQLPAEGLRLEEQEQQAIIAFLKQLKDEKFIKNKEFKTLSP
ncbi:MAG: c-type cytochrome [Bernardetiaceae bacterium]|nr:c-type cytochrome [Bernardetiaceae bacterium]